METKESPYKKGQKSLTHSSPSQFYSKKGPMAMNDDQTNFLLNWTYLYQEKVTHTSLYLHIILSIFILIYFLLKTEHG